MSLSDFASVAPLPSSALPLAGNLAGSAASAAQSGLSGVSSFPGVALAMRFQVTVDGYELGKWTSCEGLKVSFTTESVRSGGDYATLHALPQAITYDQVTLKRAVEREEYQKVQQWLRSVAAMWQTGEEVNGTSVTITLLDATQILAATWELQDAFPVSWTGPSMSATSGDVASETLVLQHSGFLEPPA